MRTPLSANSSGFAPVEEADARTLAEIVITVHGASVKDAVETLLTSPMVP
jgi:hypothetical protein